MRVRAFALIILAVFFLICGTALAENPAANDSISYDEWDWDNESVNAFSGSIDLSQWNGVEITLELTAVFEPESDAASETAPKFTHFNGSRLTMLEQRDNMTVTPETDKAVIAFSGSVKMPEKDHYNKITVDLKATDPEGKELKKISAVISRDGNASAHEGNIFYIPFEIRKVAAFIAAAAALIWCITIIRNRILNRKQ